MFAVGNLLPEFPGRAGAKGDRFPAREARARAAALRPWLLEEFDRVVLLGRHVATAFGVPSHKGPLDWFLLGLSPGGRGVWAVWVPHPSGVNHWWNDPANGLAASRFLRHLADEIAPA